jgi:hypothetical protein
MSVPLSESVVPLSGPEPPVSEVVPPLPAEPPVASPAYPPVEGLEPPVPPPPDPREIPGSELGLLQASKSAASAGAKR